MYSEYTISNDEYADVHFIYGFAMLTQQLLLQNISNDLQK